MRRLQTSAARLAISAMKANSVRSSSLFQTPKRESGRHLEQILQACKVLGSKKKNSKLDLNALHTWPRNRAGTSTHVLCRCGEATS